MLDISRITETVATLFSGSQQQSPLNSASIAELLSNAGIDPALLDGLSQEEIVALLQQHGIDPSAIDVGQLADLVHGTEVGGSIAEAVRAWMDPRRG